MDRGAAEATGCAEHGLLLKERVAARAGCAKHEVDCLQERERPKKPPNSLQSSHNLSFANLRHPFN